MRRKIFAIVGSASANSANEKLCNSIESIMQDEFDVTYCQGLKMLPHFDPELSLTDTPESIVQLRNNIQKADGVLICTPEYVFSIPSGLKNAIEWCVSTTVFSDKPLGLITASANGAKGHEELQLLMKTIMAKYTDETTLLIQGIKGKMNRDGIITDGRTKFELEKFVKVFKALVKNTNPANVDQSGVP